METAKQFIDRKNKSFTEQANKLIGMKDIGRKGKFYFVRKAWTFMPQSNLAQKVFIIERLEKATTKGQITRKKNFLIGEIEYRIAYYIVSGYGRTKGKWVWGQFCPIIPLSDFDKLIRKARREGTLK